MGTICSPKHRFYVELRGIIPQKAFVIVTAVKTSQKSAFFDTAKGREIPVLHSPQMSGKLSLHYAGLIEMLNTGFSTGHWSTEGEECSGRPTGVTVPQNVGMVAGFSTGHWSTEGEECSG
jgi:hypothetical protein